MLEKLDARVKAGEATPAEIKRVTAITIGAGIAMILGLLLLFILVWSLLVAA